MKPLHSIFEPLTEAEVSVLRAYASAPKVSTDTDPQVVKPLTARGYLQKTKAGLIVTPEGLAALLDAVSVERLK